MMIVQLHPRVQAELVETSLLSMCGGAAEASFTHPENNPRIAF